MKWVFLFLSLYIIVLSGIPCSADDDCCMEGTGVTAQRPCKGNDSKEESKIPCSPFFACGACHGIALPVTGGVAVPQFCGLLLKHLSYYSEPYAYAPPSGIWQPPKMPLSI